jgi:hypothetical protein
MNRPRSGSLSERRTGLLFERRLQLRLLDVGVAQHQLDDSDVKSVREQAAGALMTQVMPMLVDFPQVLAVHASSGLRTFRVMTVREQEQRLPRGLEVGYELAGRRAEHEPA